MTTPTPPDKNTAQKGKLPSGFLLTVAFGAMARGLYVASTKDWPTAFAAAQEGLDTALVYSEMATAGEAIALHRANLPALVANTSMKTPPVPSLGTAYC